MANDKLPNSSVAIHRLDDDEKGVRSIHTLFRSSGRRIRKEHRHDLCRKRKNRLSPVRLLLFQEYFWVYLPDLGWAAACTRCFILQQADIIRVA